MVEVLPELVQRQLRADLLAAVQALKSHVTDQGKFAAGLNWKKKERVSDIKVVRDIDKESELDELRKKMADCHLCPLGKMRKNLVFGDGNPHAKVVFVGEAPGADEDEQGLPFVGRAGQLLTKIIEAMGLSRKEVYICNILKCRPPQNRNPLPEEIAACEPFLKQQLKIISPTIICALGTFSAKTLLKTDVPISVLRGRFHSYEGIKLMPTYHPAYLLRNPAAKKSVWEDVQLIMKELQS
jgi:uracil-DNA glycosylase